MKNKSILSLFLIIAPTLCACGRTLISNEKALEILNSIEDAIYEETPFENFVETHRIVKEGSSIHEVTSFNKKEKFLHHYYINSGVDLSENWVFVRNNYIIDVNRNTNGAIDPGDEPTYTITSKVPYSDKAWKDRERIIIGDVFSYYTSAIYNSRKFINDGEISVTFSSTKTNSIYAEAKQNLEAQESKEIVFKYVFDNSKLMLQSKDDGTEKEIYEWSYGEVKVFYPNYEFKK